MQKFIAQLGQLQERFNLLAEATRAQFKTLGTQLNVMQNTMLTAGQRFGVVEDRLEAVEVGLKAVEVGLKAVGVGLKAAEVGIHQTQEAVHETHEALNETRRAMVDTSETLANWVQNYLSHLEVVNKLFDLTMEGIKKSTDLEARVDQLESQEARLNARFEALEKRLPPPEQP
ncbi:MAG TPA: hypothetical protein VGO93_21690 [Candidatus Xenobia bacterium]